MLTKLFEYQYNEMINSDYLIMDLKENEEFRYDQIDIKKQKAIDNLQKDYTILIIAHRLSTIKNANRILFIENGKIKQEGTHEELLKNCKSYKELYEAEIEK